MSVIYIAPFGGTAAQYTKDLFLLPGENSIPSYAFIPVDFETAAMWYGNVKQITLTIAYEGPETHPDIFDIGIRYFAAYYNGTYVIDKSNCFDPVPNGTYLKSGGILKNGQVAFFNDYWNIGLVSHNGSYPPFGSFDSATNRNVPIPYYPIDFIHYFDGQFGFEIPQETNAEGQEEYISGSYSPSEIVQTWLYKYDLLGEGDLTDSEVTFTWTVTDTYFAV